ncbi:MAG: response regulator [Deltaproteobacteria bacterium]
MGGMAGTAVFQGADGRTGQRRRVCVVSDSLQVRWMLAALLEAGGFATAHVGVEANGVELAVAFRPDALVVEAEGGDAKEVVGRLRNRVELSRCGLLVLSARVEPPVASQGAWAAFTRSFDLLKLHAAVALCAAGAKRVEG